MTNVRIHDDRKAITRRRKDIDIGSAILGYSSLGTISPIAGLKSLTCDLSSFVLAALEPFSENLEKKKGRSVSRCKVGGKGCDPTYVREGPACVLPI